MAKPQAVDTIDDIKRVIREVPGRHMATLSQAKGRRRHMTVTELDAAGVTAATFPSIALFAAAKGVREALGVLKRDKSLGKCRRASDRARRLLCGRRPQGADAARGAI